MVKLIGFNFAQQDETELTASTSNSNYPVDNIKSEFRAKEWRSTSNANQWVVFDLKTTEGIDSVVLLWEKENYRLSDSATIKVQANATNVWTSPALDQTLTFNDTYERASHFFSSVQSYRYWRITIDDSSNVYGYVSLGVVILGKGESIEEPDRGFNFNLNDTSTVTKTDFGHKYTDEYPILASLKIDFNYLDFESTEAFVALYNQVGTRSTLYITLDSAGTVFGRDTFALYGKFTDSLNLTHINYDILSGTGVTIEEVS